MRFQFLNRCKYTKLTIKTKTMDRVVEIDGDEGGGQVLRIALTLSCILGKSIRVVNIRSKRPNPGLSHQHYHVIDLLQSITTAKVFGKSLQSTQIEFHPGAINAGFYTVDTGTAASITLVLQAVTPVLLFGQGHSQVDVKGGTNVDMAPQVDYLNLVLRPNLKMFGVEFDLQIVNRGYYPRGGGRCVASLTPLRLIKPANLTNFGRLVKVSGFCFAAARSPARFVTDIKRTALDELEEILSEKSIDIDVIQERRDFENAAGIVLSAVTDTGCTLGASALSGKKINAGALGSSAAKELASIVDQKICVDQYLQDQLIIFMALGGGASYMRTCALTDHTRRAIDVVQLLTGVKFNVQEQDCRDEQIIISCEGIGFINKFY